MAWRGGTRPDAWAVASLTRRRIPLRRTRVRHLWCRDRASQNFFVFLEEEKKKDYKEIRLDKVDSISSIGKIFYGWIRNLGFNLYLH